MGIRFTGRGRTFSPEEDLQIVRLRAQRWTHQEIADFLAGRSLRSVQSRYNDLNKSGRAAELRLFLAAPAAPRVR